MLVCHAAANHQDICQNRAVCKGNADKEDGKEHNANQCAQSSAVFIGKGPCKRKGN